MRIITRGIPPQSLVNRFKCAYCGSILEATNEELVTIGNHNNETWFQFYCPVCEKDRTMSETDITKVEKREDDGNI